MSTERSKPRGLRGLAAGILVTAIATTSCAGVNGTARTHVSRTERLQTGIRDYDRFFRIVYEMQIAINESEHEKVDAIAHLAQAMGLPEGSDLEHCAGAVRAWSATLDTQGLHLTIEIDPGRPIGTGILTSASPAPTSGAPGSPQPSAGPLHGVPEAFPEPQDTAEREVDVEQRVAGGAMPAASEAHSRAVIQAIRAAMALKRRMDAIGSYAPMVRTAAQQLAATTRTQAGAHASQLDSEFRDAIDFLDGASGRAQAQAQAAFQVAVRIQASANTAGAP